MGRNRFEDQIKDKLAQREITPPAGSWEKLSGQLNSEKKKHAPLLWWTGIAATLLGAILIAGIVYNRNPIENTPNLVETPVEIEMEDEKVLIIEQELASEENIVTGSHGTDGISTPLKEETSQPVNQIKENTLIAGVKKENSPGSNEIEKTENNEEISRKLEEIIAQVSLEDGIAGNPTNDEIDALIYKAAREISLERKDINSRGTVNAGDLLFAVEMELEESFREKVFELLKEGYLKAKTAVANSNYP